MATNTPPAPVVVVLDQATRSCCQVLKSNTLLLLLLLLQEGNTPLHFASSMGHLQVVLDLLAWGADVHAVNAVSGASCVVVV
jgi:ankyrin repeat protein